MSNGRRFRRQIVDLFRPLDGACVPGGCADCDAVQTVEPLADGVWQLTIHHDDTCPTYRSMEANR